MWEAIIGWTRNDEDKFHTQVKKCLEPQVQKLLERRFAQWQEAVVRNEMAAVAIDVEKHLQALAAEYRRVMKEIEEQIGFHGNPVKIEEQVKQWLGTDSGDGLRQFELSAQSTLGEPIGILITGGLVEILAENVLHVATGGITFIVSGVLALVKMGFREKNLQKQLQQAILDGIHRGLDDQALKCAADIRSKVKRGFEGLERMIAGSISEEIAVIDASLQAIIDKKKQQEFSAEMERRKLKDSEGAIDASAEALLASLAKV